MTFVWTSGSAASMIDALIDMRSCRLCGQQAEPFSFLFKAVPFTKADT